MEPTSCLIDDDAEFRLPPEFLTDDDFLLEKENKLFKGDESNLFPYELSHGYGLDSGLDRTDYLTGFTRKTVRSTQEDDFSCGFSGSNANDTKVWGATRLPQSTPCGAGIGYQSCQTRASSQAAARDMYCAAVEELAMININGYNNLSGRGVLDLPRKQPLAAAKIPKDGSGYYSRQSLQYQKLQAIQFQQLKQQQLMQQQQQRRGLKANNNKTAGHVDLSPSAWPNQPQRRDGSAMRAVFLGDRTGKPRSTGTGVFLPRRVNHTDAESREKPTLATVLVPARVAEVLNLDESLVQQPVIRSSASLYESSWRQKSNNGGFSSQMKMGQGVNEPRLPSDWAY
ncbi:hypothetical protein HID58_035352 [Brassica napus]|uniref:BnaA09g54980D protein n=2 Tax=Brassica napus TaxID=3708 RepID=A0A078IXG9_BRANA|nr:uncharacterized protein LOC106411933 [Brassica napus]KAH0912031.1 hypothetical protein HID58_035352 [Brassica napus]CAF2047387.1 unnamed protein product [Brassica napus]CDY54034.1 BnaA09g54980D [Brassica napus]